MKQTKGLRPIDWEALQDLEMMRDAVPLDDGRTMLLGQYEGALGKMLELAQLIVYGKKPAFKIHGHRRLSTVIEMSDLGFLIRGIHLWCPILYASDIELPPIVQLCLDVYRAHELREFSPISPSHGLPDGRFVADVCDDYIADVRVEGIKTGIMRQQIDWVRNAENNEHTVGKYVNRLREVHGDLAMFGIDLMCECVNLSEEGALTRAAQLEVRASENQAMFFNGMDEHVPASDGQVGIEQVLSDRERLFSNLKGKSTIVKHMVGYVCSVSWSRVGGFYLYDAFIFDGKQVDQEDCLALSEAVGRYWAESVTCGRGHYKRRGLLGGDGYAAEWIGRDEDEKLDRWQRSFQRRALRDKYSRPRLPDEIKPKLFTMGRMPKLQA
ncbi:hypothetical protein [Burkholderia cepacia]|uniref:hypothetical protein n=1 Tax=Burkholderia cepacia TaxID=292 RepID=UPI002651C425|nr:hypothetical protein [Burkholderia cepacia]MDN7914771.1 hypothetical protein [Burkholderia cepacia]